MTPKEKSKELVDRMLINVKTYFNKGTDEYEVAKDCALTCANEILKELEQLRKPEYTTFVEWEEGKEVSDDKIKDGYEKKEYWEEVINEIEAL